VPAACATYRHEFFCKEAGIPDERCLALAHTPTPGPKPRPRTWPVCWLFCTTVARCDSIGIAPFVQRWLFCWLWTSRLGVWFDVSMPVVVLSLVQPEHCSTFDFRELASSHQGCCAWSSTSLLHRWRRWGSCWFVGNKNRFVCFYLHSSATQDVDVVPSTPIESTRTHPPVVDNVDNKTTRANAKKYPPEQQPQPPHAGHACRWTTTLLSTRTRVLQCLHPQRRRPPPRQPRVVCP